MSRFNLPDTMKCFVYGTESGLVQEEIRTTKHIQKMIERHQQNQQKDVIVVQVYAVGLNPVDAKDVMGDKIPRSCSSLRSWTRRYLVQHNIIGFEFSGIVVSSSSPIDHNKNTNSTNGNTAPNIKDPDKMMTALQDPLKPYGIYQKGDYVFGTVPPFHGTLAEYILVPCHQICHMPLHYYSEKDDVSCEEKNNNPRKEQQQPTSSFALPNQLLPTPPETNSKIDGQNKYHALKRHPLHFYQAACMPLV
jgi:hypothetical protein